MTERILAMWAVYASPRDYPGQFVARKFLITRALGPAVTDDMFVAESLDEVRALLPTGLYCLPRQKHDDPVIVETWL
jgi:hypothetical protein